MSILGLYEEVRRIEPVSSRVETGRARSYIVLGKYNTYIDIALNILRQSLYSPSCDNIRIQEPGVECVLSPGEDLARLDGCKE